MITDRALYDLVHTGNAGDVDFYVEECLNAERVLEVGCGSGRLLSQLKHAVGIDQDVGAIDLATARGLDARVADMSDFVLSERFDRVIVPYNTLFCAPNDDALLACLRRCRQHLRPSGVLIYDVYATEEDHIDMPEEHLATTWLNEVRIDIFESHRAPAKNRLDACYRYLLDGTEERILNIVHHSRSPRALLKLTGAAGFDISASWGGFDRVPRAPGSERLVVRATAT